MLLDDLHWADTTSLSLLLYLARHLAGARILILSTYRDTEMDRAHPLRGRPCASLSMSASLKKSVCAASGAAETAKLVGAQLGGASVY